jgi:hypothetical protein
MRRYSRELLLPVFKYMIENAKTLSRVGPDFMRAAASLGKNGEDLEQYVIQGARLMDVMLPELPEVSSRHPVEVPENSPWQSGAVINEDGTVVKFTEQAVRCVISTAPLYIREAPYSMYTEVEIVELGSTETYGDTCVSIGLVPPAYPPICMVGWQANSIGLHR